MELTQRRTNDSSSSAARRSKVLGLLLAAVALLFVSAQNAPEGATVYERHTREHFRHEMWKTIRADHPAIVPVANAIRAITHDPLQQLVVVNDVTHLLVDYDEDIRVYGRDEFHATLDEMLAKRRENGWLYLRDDCDGRAVFAAHLLASLGIPFRLEASYWKEHAWVIARVNGVDYDLLDLRRDAPETRQLGYRLVGHFFVRKSHPPPPFSWRTAWAVATMRNVDIGKRLGLLTLDSTPTSEHERHATDWTEEQPDSPISPFDPRTLTTAVAGFPYGETLRISAMAANVPRPAPKSTATTLAGVTGSAHSGN